MQKTCKKPFRTCLQIIYDFFSVSKKAFFQNALDFSNTVYLKIPSNSTGLDVPLLFCCCLGIALFLTWGMSWVKVLSVGLKIVTLAWSHSWLFFFYVFFSFLMKLRRGHVTRLGEFMVQFPLPPNLTCAVIKSASLDCEDLLLPIAAMLSVEKVFIRPGIAAILVVVPVVPCLSSKIPGHI